MDEKEIKESRKYRNSVIIHNFKLVIKGTIKIKKPNTSSEETKQK